MTDTTTAPDANDDKREQVAIHSWLDAEGNETKDIHVATGYRRKDKATNEIFEYKSQGKAGSAAVMLELFGAKTKATNEASQVRQAERRGEDVDGSETDNVIEVFEQIANGVWREVREGGGAAKVDRDALAASIVEAKQKAGLPAEDVLTYRQKLDDDVAWFRKVRKNPEVTAIYNAKVGKAPAKPVSVSDL